MLYARTGPASFVGDPMVSNVNLVINGQEMVAYTSFEMMSRKYDLDHETCFADYPKLHRATSGRIKVMLHYDVSY